MSSVESIRVLGEADMGGEGMRAACEEIPGGVLQFKNVVSNVGFP